jgi:hypothetical protein
MTSRQHVVAFDWWCVLQEARVRETLRNWRFLVGRVRGTGM